MAQEIINIGTTPNDGTGDPLRTAFTKANQNFTELYDTADTQDLDFTGDSGTGAVELDSQTLNLVGTNGVQTTASGQTITIDTSSLDTRLTTAEADIDTNTASITTEETARVAADTTLQTNINTEASTRSSADTALQGQIDSNDTDIATNAANIATNTTNISSNDTDISGLDTRLTTAEGNITSNDTDITGLDNRLTTAEGNISSNDTDIATNASNIATNVTNIATNVTDIATNATDIATNVTNIASNDTDISNLQSGKQDISEKNQANGYAPLDSGAKIPIANLPDSVVGQVEYQGTWDASIDDPTLPSASTVKGHYYVVSVGGTYETITYAIGDWIISNGVAWEKIDNTDAVTTVFGRLGAIVANEGDYSSYYPLIADLTAAEADITTNATNISSNDTDITALQNDKYDKTGGTITGNATITGNLIVDTNTLYVDSANNRVGIGTTSPSDDLEIASSVPTIRLTDNITGNPYHTISGAGNGDVKISVDAGNSGPLNSNFIVEVDTVQRFNIAHDGDITFNTDDLFIDGVNNRVGIGTSSPDTLLNIEGSSPILTIEDSRTVIGTETIMGRIDFKQNDDSGSGTGVSGSIYSISESSTGQGSGLAFNTGVPNSATEKMRITSGGNVGIGTDSPDEIFHIKATNAPTIRIESGDTSGASGEIIGEVDFWGNDFSGTGRDSRAFVRAEYEDAFARAALVFATGAFNETSTERMRIDSSGNVGIGMTPSYLLDLQATEKLALRYFVSTTFKAGIQVATTAGDMISTSAVDDFAIRSNSNILFASGGNIEKMRITSGGNVLINNTNTALYSATSGSGYLLEDGVMTIARETTADTQPLLVLNDTGVDGKQISFRRDGLEKVTFGVVSDALTVKMQDAERMRITSGGNVGIGTTSPVSLFNVAKGSIGEYMRVGGDNSSNQRALVFSTSTTNSVGDTHTINARSSNGVIAFATGGTERMRITSGGNLYINTTSGAGENKDKLIYSPVASWLVQNHSTARTSGSHYTLFYYGTTAIGSITQSGTTGVSYNETSDYRLKENVVPITGALDRVDALKPSRFNFIADADITVDGFLAHELAEVVPEAVTGEKDAVDEEGNAIYQGIDKGKIVPLLVGAIQELRAEIETLKSQINN